MLAGSGTALTPAPPIPPSDAAGAALGAALGAAPRPSRLPLVICELDGVNEPASANPDAIGLPSAAEGASVNVAPLPMISAVWLM